MRTFAKTIAAVLLVATPCAAQDADPEAPPPQRVQGGSHFIAEPQAGMHVQGAGGFVYGGYLGFGGKPRWSSARFYVIAGFLRSRDNRVGPIANDGGRWSQDLQLTDVDAGLRVYFPIIGPLRLTTEALLGATIADASVRDTDLYFTQQNHAQPHLLLGLGPQLRILPELSLGVLAETLFTDTGEIRSDGALAGWKDGLSRRTLVTGTVTFHW